MSEAAPREKWRPSLGLIIFAVLAIVILLPLVALLFYRSLEASVVGERLAVSLVVLGTIAVAAGVGFVLLRTVTAPIGELTDRSRRIAEGDRAAIVRLRWHGTREIAALSESLLTMARRLVDRSDYIQTLSGHLTHELKSPLTAIGGATELLRESGDAMSPEERHRFLDNIASDTLRLTTLVQRLRELAAADNPRAAGATTIADILPGLRRPDMTIVAEGDIEAPIGLLLENAVIAFSHLVDNSALHGATRVQLSVTRDERLVTVLVADDGEGISPANRDKVFDAFFTTRRDSGGTGMGLGIVAAMLRAHGGAIRLVDSAKGAVFSLTFPAG